MTDALTLHAFTPEWRIETECSSDPRDREFLLTVQWVADAFSSHLIT